MGSLLSSEPKKIRKHELALMSACSEGFSYKKPRILDRILEQAE